MTLDSHRLQLHSAGYARTVTLTYLMSRITTSGVRGAGLGAEDAVCDTQQDEATTRCAARTPLPRVVTETGVSVVALLSVRPSCGVATPSIHPVWVTTRLMG